MVFKRMLGAFGVGAPSVDTVLPNPSTRPGLILGGQVNLTGGSRDVEIDHITVGLVTRIEVDGAEEEYDAFVEFHRVGVAGGLPLAEGQQVSLPFQIPVPWETPVTDFYGQNLRGMTMGLRTEVAIRGAVDRGGHGYHPEYHEERGPGMGAVAAGVIGAAALGFAGGMVAEEVFDSFGGDEEGDEGGDEE